MLVLWTQALGLPLISSTASYLIYNFKFDLYNVFLIRKLVVASDKDNLCPDLVDRLVI
jgi:hypothetical protein